MSNKDKKLDEINTMIDMVHGMVEGAAGLPPQEDTQPYQQGHKLGAKLGYDQMDNLIDTMRDLRQQRNDRLSK